MDDSHHSANKVHRNSFPRHKLPEPSALSPSPKLSKPTKSSSKIHSTIPRTSPPVKNGDRISADSKDAAKGTTSLHHGYGEIATQLAGHENFGEIKKMSVEEDKNGECESLHEEAEGANVVILNAKSESLQHAENPNIESPEDMQKESMHVDKSVYESNQIEFDGSMQSALNILTQHLHSEKESFLFSKGEQVLSPGDCKIAEENMSNLSCLESAMILSADILEQSTEFDGKHNNRRESLESHKKTYLSKVRYSLINVLQSFPWKTPTHMRAYSLVFSTFCIIWYIFCTTKPLDTNCFPPT